MYHRTGKGPQKYWHLYRCDFRSTLIYAHTTLRTPPTCNTRSGLRTVGVPEAGDLVESVEPYHLGGKGRRCLWSTRPPSCVDCLESWEPRPPGVHGLSRSEQGFFYASGMLFVTVTKMTLKRLNVNCPRHVHCFQLALHEHELFIIQTDVVVNCINMLVPMRVVNWISSSSQFPFVLQISTRKVPMRHSTGMKYRDKSPFRMPGMPHTMLAAERLQFQIKYFIIQFLHTVLFIVISFWRYTPLLTNPPGHEASPKLILWECLKVNLPPYPHTFCKRLQITMVVFLILSRRLMFTSGSFFYQELSRQLSCKGSMCYSTLRHCNGVWLGTRLEEGSAVNGVHM